MPGERWKLHPTCGANSGNAQPKKDAFQTRRQRPRYAKGRKPPGHGRKRPGQGRLASLAQVNDPVERRRLEFRPGIVNERPAEVIGGRQPDPVAQGAGGVTGFGNTGRDRQRTRWLKFHSSPMDFKSLREFPAQRIEIGPGRHIDRLGRETTELIVGENIDGAGAGLARRQAVRLA